MSEQTNYNTQKISCQDASLVFGGISKDKSVISSFEIRARDGRHIFRKDRSGKRKGWTTSISPGNFQVKAGLDNISMPLGALTVKNDFPVIFIIHLASTFIFCALISI